jgi:hypothetical protein
LYAAGAGVITAVEVFINAAVRPRPTTRTHRRKIAAKVISPTHKRTEGQAPVWGSEFTSKDAALLGESSRNRC